MMILMSMMMLMVHKDLGALFVSIKFLVMMIEIMMLVVLVV